MDRIVSPLFVAFLLGSALGSAVPVPDLVAAGGFPGVDIPAGARLMRVAAAEPQDIRSPGALTIDDMGRIFITENLRMGHGIEDDREHREWYLDDLAARSTSDRSALNEKWGEKIPRAHLTKKSERVRCLSDVDGDGVFEQSKVFADGFDAPLDGAAGGILAYQGGVYVACIPKLWLLRDSKGNGVADERKALVDGFGVRISIPDHEMHGLTLGPDGRIYGTLGDRGLNLTTKDGKTWSLPNQGCVFRVEADGSGFEIFHSGLRAPRGVCFDAFGNAFTVDGDAGMGDAPRLIYLVEGGDSGWRMEHQALHDFHRQIGLTETPPDPWTAEHMWELRNEQQPAFIVPPAAHLTNPPTGLASHPGTGFLEVEAGRLLIGEQGNDAAHSGIVSLGIKPDGAGMQVTDSRPLLRGLAATAMEFSWDGRLFLTNNGGDAVYSLAAGDNTWRANDAADAARLIREGFAQRDPADLAKLLRHPDSRIRLRAQLALTRMPDALERFSAAVASTDLMERIHGIWGLGILARRGTGAPLPPNGDSFGDVPDNKLRANAGQKLADLLKDPNAEIRAQAVRALGDGQNQFVRVSDPRKNLRGPRPNANITAEGLPLGALLIDESPRVRFFAAITIGKLKALGFFGPVCEFLTDNNNRDPYLRHAGAFALRHLATQPAMLAGLESHASPAVRLAACAALRQTGEVEAGTFINDADTRVADEAIRAVTDLSLDEVRIPLAFQLDNLAARPWQPFMLRRLVHSAFRAGTAQNVARLLKAAGNPAVPAEVRKEILRLLALWVEPPPVDQLTGHWRPLAKRSADEVKPVLTKELPRLLKQEGFIRAAALELAKQYQIDLPADSAPTGENR